MKKNIFAILLGLSLLPFGAFAQSENSAVVAGASVQTQNPAEVYVQNLTLSTTHGQAGEVLRGTFLLVNARTEPVSNVYYHVLLMKRAASGEMQVFDDKSFGPESLSGSQKKNVQLEYSIPAGISGAVTIRVRAVLGSGFKMGWKDASFVIDGTSSQMDSLVVTRASVIVNNKVFAPAEGPTVFPGDEASYDISVKNTGTKSVTITPTLSVYKKDVTGAPFLSNASKEVTIGAGSTETISIALPQDSEPNSYEAKVELRNQSNENVAPLLSFRYLIGGDILTIQSVTSDKKTVVANETVNLSLAYTGTPADLTGRVVHVVGKTDVTVFLKNEKGDIVSSSTSPVDFNASEGVVLLPVQITDAAKALSASVVVIKAGKVLTRFDGVLSTNPQKDEALELSFKKVVTIISIIVLLIILFGAGMLWKKFRNPAAMIVAMIIVGALYGGYTSKAEAFTVTDSYNVSRTIFTGQDWRPTVFVNDPYGTVAPGEQFYVNMDVEILACHNKPSYVTYFAKDWNASSYTNMGQVNRGADNGVEHFSYSYVDTVSCGTGKCVSSGSAASPGMMFTAPSTPGVYRIYFRILNDPHISTIVVNPTNPNTFTHTPVAPDDGTVSGGHELNYGWVEGYQEFTVAAPPVQLANGDIYVERTIVGGSATGTQARLGPYTREGVRYAFTSAASTTIMTDLTGNGGDALASTTVTTNSPDVPAVLTGQKSAFIQAGNFTAGSGLVYNSEPITIPDQVLRGARTGTISLWVKWNGSQQCSSGLCGTVIARQSPASNGYINTYNAIIALDGQNPNSAHLVWHPYTSGGVNIVSSAVVGTGWHNVVVSFDPRNHYVYLDGVLVASYTFGSDKQMDTTEGLTSMGQLYGGGSSPNVGHAYSNINVADIRIYPRPLSSAEASTLNSGGTVAYPQQWVAANSAKFTYIPLDTGGGKTYNVNVSPDYTFEYDLAVGWCLFNKSSASDCTPTTYVPRSNYSTQLCDTVSCTVPVTLFPSWGCSAAEQTSTTAICGKEGYVTKVSFKYTKKPTAITSKTYCSIMINNGLGWTADYFNYRNPSEANTDWHTYPDGSTWPIVGTAASPHPTQARFMAGNWFNKSGPYYASGVGFSTQEQSLIHGYGDPRIGSAADYGFYPFTPKPDHTFGAHWNAIISTTTSGTYTYTISNTDDDVWVYVDGVLQTFNGRPYPGSPGVKDFTNYKGSISLQANVPRTIDIYYGQRAASGSGFNFIFDVNNAGIDNAPVEKPCTTVTNRGLLVRKVGPTGSELEVPIRNTSGGYTGADVKIDDAINTMTGSSVLKWAPALTTGTHTVGAQQITGYYVSVGACKYRAVTADITPSSECEILSTEMASTTCASGWCTPQSGTGDVTKDFRIKKINGTFENYPSSTLVEDGVVTKVVFKYTAVPLQPINASCSGTPNFGVGNLTTTWSSTNPTGGNGTYTYQWNEMVPSGNAEGLTGVTWSVGTATGTTQTISSKYVYDPSQFGVNTANGTQFKSTQLTVSSGSADPKVINCGYVYVNPAAAPATISCSPSKTSIIRGQSVTWTVSGGAGGSAYQWNFTGSPGSVNPLACASGYSTSCGSVTTQYITAGTKRAFVSLQGSTGPEVSCSTAVNVSELPVYKQF